jgi:hypothetical protein
MNTRVTSESQLTLQKKKTSLTGLPYANNYVTPAESEYELQPLYASFISMSIHVK